MDGAYKILIGITGGIAAYKIPQLVRLLRKKNCEIKVVLTTAAKPLVGVETLRTLSGNPVYADGDCQYDMGHIRLSEWADVFVICPATANTIAKITAGIADNLLTTLTLSIPEEKIIVAPAMNCAMWANKATLANIKAICDRGITVLPVGYGELACGVEGYGRMAEIETIVDSVLSHRGEASCRNICNNNKLAGKKVLMSSGPTEEFIDPVRVITNRSSGKMGAALAKAALDFGATVTVVSGPAREPLPVGAEVIPVLTATEMELEMGKRFAVADICIMAAAVSDYRPVNPSDTKLHRFGGENINLELTPNPDILAGLGASKSTQFLVGFSLECGDDMDRSWAKMREKNCDMMVFNKAAVALGKDNTEFTLLYKGGHSKSFSVMDKTEAARIILENIV